MNLEVFTPIESDARIAFVGDAHLNMYTPSSRVDDYAVTCIEKLLSLLDVCKMRKVESLVFTGDVFHQTAQSIPFMVSVMAVFSEFQKAGIKVFSIVGNHDIKNELLENIEKSPLGLCYLSGVIRPLGQITQKTSQGVVVVKGIHFGKPIPPKDVPSYVKSICVAHVFFDMGFDADDISKENCVKLGHDYYVFGHDHVPYEPKKLKGPINQIVIRPGSFMRASSHEYNVIDRKVFVDIYDPIEDSWIRDSLFIRPASEVFSARITDKVDTKESEDELREKFTNLVNQLYSKDVKKVSIYSVMDSLSLDVEVKATIEQYLYAFGIVRAS